MVYLQWSLVLSTFVLISVSYTTAQQFNSNGRLQNNQQGYKNNNINNNNYQQQSGFPNGNGNGNDYGSKKTGYKYNGPPPTRGYIYMNPNPTTTTSRPRLPPSYENTEENDSQFDNLDPAHPSPVSPDRDFVTNKPSAVAGGVNGGRGGGGEWDIRDSVPGQPAQDYPILSRIPKTSFSCQGRIPGFYVDPETRCQVFHRCNSCNGSATITEESFLCPNGTQFNQQVLTCDWWGNVECPGSEKFYELNKQLGYQNPDGSYAELTATRMPPSIKKVAPKIIPKSEREPLPPELRSNHFHSDSQSHHDADSSRPNDDDSQQNNNNNNNNRPNNNNNNNNRPNNNNNNHNRPNNNNNNNNRPNNNNNNNNRPNNNNNNNNRPNNNNNNNNRPNNNNNSNNRQTNNKQNNLPSPPVPPPTRSTPKLTNNFKPTQNQIPNQRPNGAKSTETPQQPKGFESEKDDDGFFNDYFNDNDDNLQGDKSNIQKILSKFDDLDAQAKTIGYRSGAIRSNGQQQRQQSSTSRTFSQSRDDDDEYRNTQPATFIVNQPPPEDILRSNSNNNQERESSKSKSKFQQQHLQLPTMDFQESNERKENKVKNRIENQNGGRTTTPDDEYLPPTTTTTTTTTRRPVFNPPVEPKPIYPQQRDQVSGGYIGGGYSYYDNNNSNRQSPAPRNDDFSSSPRNKPNDEYLPPRNNNNQNEYSPLSNDNKPNDEYLPPRDDNNNYKSNDDYSSRPPELNRYVTPPSFSSKESYGEPPPATDSSYLPVADSHYRKPSSGYGAPQSTPKPLLNFDEYSAPQEQPQQLHIQLPFAIASPNIQFLSQPLIQTASYSHRHTTPTYTYHSSSRHLVTPTPIIFQRPQYLVNL